METGFWHAKWEKNEIGFHLDQVNPLLVEHFGRLALAAGQRVFVPLCGKTRDIHWLLDAGYRVAGAELSPTAVEQLFADLGVTPDISQVGALGQFSAPGIDIYVGDIFALAAGELGPVDAVYDRAALVALPETMRRRYAHHLAELTHRAPQLLIAYEYDQSRQDGPPFSVSADEVARCHGDRFALSLLASVDVPGGLKGKCPAQEHVWLLTRP